MNNWEIKCKNKSIIFLQKKCFKWISSGLKSHTFFAQKQLFATIPHGINKAWLTQAEFLRCFFRLRISSLFSDGTHFIIAPLSAVFAVPNTRAHQSCLVQTKDSLLLAGTFNATLWACALLCSDQLCVDCLLAQGECHCYFCHSRQEICQNACDYSNTQPREVVFSAKHRLREWRFGLH